MQDIEEKLSDYYPFCPYFSSGFILTNQNMKGQLAEVACWRKLKFILALSLRKMREALFFLPNAVLPLLIKAIVC